MEELEPVGEGAILFNFLSGALVGPIALLMYSAIFGAVLAVLIQGLIKFFEITKLSALNKIFRNKNIVTRNSKASRKWPKPFKRIPDKYLGLAALSPIWLPASIFTYINNPNPEQPGYGLGIFTGMAVGLYYFFTKWS